MTEAVSLEDLAGMPAGAELGAALHAVAFSAVPNDRMLELARAQYRQVCHEQARMAEVLIELARCDGVPSPGAVSRTADPDPYAVHETRAALRWTRSAAEAEHALAEFALGELPAVFAAWYAGDIDRPRVRVFEQYLYGLAADHIAAVCAIAIPRAPSLTTGQLASLLRRMVIAVDPAAADRWYRQRVRERGVCAYLAPDGTVTLSGHGLPADEAEAACGRVEQLAAAARRSGHPGTIGQIRADVFLALLDGRYHGMAADHLVAALVADHHRAAGTGDDTSTAETEPPRRTARAAPADRQAGHAARPPARTARVISDAASRSAWSCPPCSASTTTPVRSPAWARYRRRSHGRAPPCRSGPSGDSPWSTRAAVCSAKASRGAGPQAPHAPALRRAGSSNCMCRRIC